MPALNLQHMILDHIPHNAMLFKAALAQHVSSLHNAVAV
jgi:hypothetical protein